MRPKQVIVLCSLAKLSGQPTEMLEGGGGIVMGWYLIQVEYRYFYYSCFLLHKAGQCTIPAWSTDSVYLYLLKVKYSLISSLINRFSLDRAGLGSV